MGYSAGHEWSCKNCGEEHQLSYWRSDEPQFCDNACQAEYQNDLHEVECSFCGRMKTVNQSEYERNEHFFCNRECWNEHQKSRVEVQCEVCGDREWVTPTRADEYRTCSKECLGRVQAEEFSGDGNPNYNSNVSDDELRRLYVDEDMSLPQISEEVYMSAWNIGIRLHKMGVDVDEPGYPKDVKTDFGLMVRSRYEKEVAEYLDGHGIQFEYEPEFPGPYIPDFVLGDGRVVEVWGVQGDNDYDTRKLRKEQWYRENGYEVIGVEPQNINQQISKVIIQS